MEDSFGVRRRDTTKGPPLRILSLDGGGVRGYSMFIILQELMHRMYVEIEGEAPRRDQIPKPADHFDLIVGTGTGGLIALMLGRLRLDLETCKELYVRLTRVVFETDKRIAGIPYRPTLFKASKLEEAIRECVREHTIFEREGNDGTSSEPPLNPAAYSSAASPRRHLSNASVVSFSARSPQSQMARPALHPKYGNANARLYDCRENRTKTAVTAVYKGTPKGGAPALLRSYDSRKEPPPEFDCKIWEAGRATCAIGLAFKAIQIGQSVFHDDGGGTFNPAPETLDEAVVNEWPGREVGVFVSVGTGKRPRGSDADQAVWYEGFLGEFADARRRLIAKIEGCETIHERMKKEHLARRGVNIENYYRFNVEIGVGEFGMNEWNRLADISTSTRRYMSQVEERKMIQGASAKLAKIHNARMRLSRMPAAKPMEIPEPFAVELPADIPSSWPPHNTPPSRQSYESGPETLAVPTGNTPSPRSSNEHLRPAGSPQAAPPTPPRPTQPRPTGTGSRFDMPDRLVVTAPTPSEYRYAGGADKIAIIGSDDHPQRRPKDSAKQPQRIEPPPLPPKTPILEQQHFGGGHRTSNGNLLPYPPDDELPPVVNMARKPDYRGR